jgi:hypothetical protein
VIFHQNINPDRPKIPFKIGNWVSRNRCQTQLDILIDEALCLYSKEEDGYKRAMKAEKDAQNQIAWEMSAEQPTLDMCMSIFMGAIYLGHINDAIRWIRIDIQGIFFRLKKKLYFISISIFIHRRHSIQTDEEACAYS